MNTARRTLKVLGIGLLALTTIFAIAVAWPSPSAPLPDGEQDRFIANVRIVDVETGTVGDITRLRITDGRIAAIGAQLQPAGTEKILNGKGGYLIPGLWDMHVHTFQSSPQVHFPLWIANGVTHVRDMMDCPGSADSLIACQADKARWNEEVQAGRMAAPTVVEPASFYLASPDLTPRQAADRVADYDERGLGAIKIYNQLSRDAFHAAAQESEKRDLRLVGHLPQAVSLEEALAAGQDSFEHAHLLPRACFNEAADWRSGMLSGLSAMELSERIVEGYDVERCDKLVADFAASGAYYVPTHVTREDDVRALDSSPAPDAALDYLDPLSAWAWNDDQAAMRGAFPGQRGAQVARRYFAHGLRLTGKAHAGGVRILVGTDTIAGGLRYHDELAHLVATGMTPAEVLRAATLEAARYTGLSGEAGSIAIGKRADLVLLAENPLVDIANTRAIRAVIQDGRLYDQYLLSDLSAFARDQANAPHNWAKLLWGFARSSVNSEM